MGAPLKPLQSRRLSRLFRIETQWNAAMKIPLYRFTVSITPEERTFHSDIQLYFKPKKSGPTARLENSHGSSRPNWTFRILFFPNFFRFQGMAFYKLHSYLRPLALYWEFLLLPRLLYMCDNMLTFS